MFCRRRPLLIYAHNTQCNKFCEVMIMAMQLHNLLIIIFIFIKLVSSRPHTGFHSVSFIDQHTNHPPFGFTDDLFSPSTHRFSSPTRIEFRYPIPGFGRALEAPESMWPQGVFLPPEDTNLHLERGHFSPDFSNGLDYPDPFLLTGHAAKRAVAYLFRKELFYGDYPHAAAVLRHNEERRRNGLAGNYLSSSRHESPFYRY